MATGFYTPANPMPDDVFNAGVRLERVDADTLMLTGSFERRVGLERQLFEKRVNANDDDTGFKRSWETMWQQANANYTNATLDWDNYDGAIDPGAPNVEDEPPP